MHVDKAHPFWGWLCIALGLFPMLLVTGVLEMGKSAAKRLLRIKKPWKRDLE